MSRVPKVFAAVLVGTLIAVVVRSDAGGAGPDLMTGWYVYDYRAGTDVSPAVNEYEPASIVGDEVWANHRDWSIDDPETPDSVLALSRYERWEQTHWGAQTTKTAGPDLRGGCVSFELRGDGLDLHGGRVTFWVMSSFQGERWHTDLPAVTSEWRRFEVDVDKVKWRNSWRWDPTDPPNLAAVLAHGNSFGIGFVGFDGEPTGALGLRRFEIGC